MFKFVDEKGNNFDPITELYETYEIQTVSQFIPPNAKVLELGGRLGVVSNFINKKLENKKAHVVVEPQEIYYKALQKNKELNYAEYSILDGVISQIPLKYISGDFADKTVPCSVEEINIKTYSYQDALNLLTENNRFDHLVVDCEGSFERFLDENIQYLPDWKFIFIEYDCTDICNYNKIESTLLKVGFQKKPISIIHNIFFR